MSFRRKPEWTFYYDGECGLCKGLVKWLVHADLSKQIDWIGFQTLSQPPKGLSWGDLNTAAYLETGAGDLYEGFFAIRWLSVKLPPLWPLAIVLWTPGASLLGVPAYRWVARNRGRLSRIISRDAH